MLYTKIGNDVGLGFRNSFNIIEFITNNEGAIMKGFV